VASSCWPPLPKALIAFPFEHEKLLVILEPTATSPIITASTARAASLNPHVKDATWLYGLDIDTFDKKNPIRYYRICCFLFDLFITPVDYWVFKC